MKQSHKPDHSSFTCLGSISGFRRQRCCQWAGLARRRSLGLTVANHKALVTPVPRGHLGEPQYSWAFPVCKDPRWSHLVGSCAGANCLQCPLRILEFLSLAQLLCAQHPFAHALGLFPLLYRTCAKLSLRCFTALTPARACL